MFLEKKFEIVSNYPVVDPIKQSNKIKVTINKLSQINHKAQVKRELNGFPRIPAD